MRSRRTQLLFASTLVLAVWFFASHIHELQNVNWDTENIRTNLLVDMREAARKYQEYMNEVNSKNMNNGSDNGGVVGGGNAGMRIDTVERLLQSGEDDNNNDGGGGVVVVQKAGSANATGGGHGEPSRTNIQVESPVPVKNEGYEIQHKAPLPSPAEPTPSMSCLPKMSGEQVSNSLRMGPGSARRRSYGGYHHGNGNRKEIKHFFALDTYQSVDLIPRLMSSIVQTMIYLGPDYSAVSVVQGHSDDSTYDILSTVKAEIQLMGAEFHLNASSVDTARNGVDRVAAMSELRNMALAPLIDSGSAHSSDATIIFMDNVALCPEDILELLYQHVSQSAHMTCAFDWILSGSAFHDVWASRSMAGDLFLEAPQDASPSWNYNKDALFLNEPDSRERYEAFQPLQVYSCWRGMVTINAAPFAAKKLKFRSAERDECDVGDATLLAKDMWRQDLGKMLAVPAVNVGYSNDEGMKTKQRRGHVGDHVDISSDKARQGELVEWQRQPPGKVKCLPNRDQPTWVQPA
ncbi:hypothetical protein VTN00DRAFT_4972 [Thermoascus crustaceus]|uniref:uncharacterized protein n=1 Tax=Thermoascus crustaceus TaxID=5088 RepID=UPI003744A0F0